MTDTSRFRGWLRPGPVPPGGLEPDEGETLDAICGHFKIFQRRKGQRFTTDDLLLAWYATQWAPRVERAADLGSGIGSVAIASAWRLPGATFFTIEAQDASVHLAARSVAYNGLEDRFRIVSGDLRNPSAFEGEGSFDLVTANPPYFIEGAAAVASDEQAAAARIEIRGDVADYANAAKRILRPGGVFALVFPHSRLSDAADALESAGFVILRRRDVAFKEGSDPMLSLILGVQSEDLPTELVRQWKTLEESELVVRTADGSFTREYSAVRMSFGFPPGEVRK